MAEYYDVKDPELMKKILFAPLRPILKVQLLDYLENAVGEITQDINRSNAGNIEISYQQGVRRTCSVTVINKFNKYNPSFNRGIWFHTKFKVYVGFQVQEDNYWFTQGIFVLTNPSILDNNSEQTVTLNGVDKFGILGSETSFHELEGIYKIPAGTRIKKAIRSMLSLPIGNRAGRLLTTTISGTEYWDGAHSSSTGGYFLNQKFNLIPSAIKVITITRNGNDFINKQFAYNTGTSSLWFSAPQGDRDYILANDLITITAYEGYPIDPKPPIIDNRIINYYDSIEFLADDETTYDSQNRYILRDNDGMLPNVPYSQTLPFYKVYINREEVPYNDTSATRYYTYNAADNAIWFSGAALDPYDHIAIVAAMRGTIGDIKLPYDVEKSPNEFFSDILIELATIVACDIYYDEHGYLNFIKGNEKPDMDNLPTLWRYEENDGLYLNASLDMDFTNMFNVIKVVGTNENAKDICEYTARNEQLNSPMCIQLLGEKIKYIESSFCYNQPRTEDFANYMLRKYSRVQCTLSFESALIPFLDANSVITITDSHLEYKDVRFIIQNLSIPLTTDAAMNVECSNTANIPYFVEQEG